MALSDPFSTTYEGSRQAGMSLGAGIQQAAGAIAKPIEEANQQKMTMNMLKQFGILTEEDNPYTINELKKIAQDKAGAELNIESTLPEEEQSKVAMRLLESSGIRLPKRTTMGVNLDRAKQLQGLEIDEGKIKYKSPTATAPSVGVYTADPQGNITQTGTVPARSKVLTASQLMTPEQKEVSKGTGELGQIPASEMGKFTLADESIGSIQKARDVIYPDGTPGSFNRVALARARAAGKGAAAFDKDSQNVYRWLGTALSARQLIQTGVAVRPDETKALVNQFIGGVLSDPEANFEGLQQLESFYKNYISNLQTKGQWDKGMGSQVAQAAGTAPKSVGLKVGTIKGGYKFTGGNPSDKNNWEKQ